MSDRNLTINDKLQVTIVTYLRCGGIVNNQIKKGLLLSPPINNFLLNMWHSYGQKGALCSALSFSSVVARHTKGTRQPPSCL